MSTWATNIGVALCLVLGAAMISAALYLCVVITWDWVSGKESDRE